MKDYEQTWEEFWKPICENEDGSLNLEQVKKELHDFRLAMQLVPKVYDDLTGGRHTKILTRPEYILQAAEDYFRELIEIENEETVQAQVAEIERLKQPCKGCDDTGWSPTGVEHMGVFEVVPCECSFGEVAARERIEVNQLRAEVERLHNLYEFTENVKATIDDAKGADEFGLIQAIRNIERRVNTALAKING